MWGVICLTFVHSSVILKQRSADKSACGDDCVGTVGVFTVCEAV